MKLLWMLMLGLAFRLSKTQNTSYSVQTEIICNLLENYVFCASSSDVLVVEDAFYGRKNADTCNRDNLPDQDTNCVSEGSYDVIKEKCHCNANCFLESFDIRFNESCTNTTKYINVTYCCVPLDVCEASTSCFTKETTIVAMTTSPTPPTTQTTTTPSTTSTTVESVNPGLSTSTLAPDGNGAGQVGVGNMSTTLTSTTESASPDGLFVIEDTYVWIAIAISLLGFFGIVAFLLARRYKEKHAKEMYA